MYITLYLIHVSAVCGSGLFFVVRGTWMLTDSQWLNARWVRISPHVIDTVLLGAAVGLMIATRQYPFDPDRGVDWLTVKVIALIAYIVLGMFALRRGRSRALRTACFIAAVATFGFMVSVALTRSPFGWFALV